MLRGKHFRFDRATDVSEEGLQRFLVSLTDSCHHIPLEMRRTPLYDAIGKTCKQLKDHIRDDANANVVVTIITDGYENSSKEWTGLAVKKLIEDENNARGRHYQRLNDMCAPGAAPMSDEELREQKKKISRNYFNKEVK